MSFKTSGTYMRPKDDGSETPPEQKGTQVFPLPPRASESNARRPTSPSAPGVSVRATLGVGASEAAPPRPGRRVTPTVNEPTRIFVVSPPPPEQPGAAADVEVSRRTATYATQPFSPVPNARVVARSVARPNPAPSAPVEATKPAASKSVQTQSPAPLLRAFEAGRSGTTTWSTAKTVAAPLGQIAEEHIAAQRIAKQQGASNAEGPVAKAQSGPIDASATKPRRASQGLLARLNLSSTPRKLSALLLVMTALLTSGSFVGKTLAKKGLLRGVARTAAAAPRVAAVSIEPGARPAMAAAPAEAAPAAATPVEPAPLEEEAAAEAAPEEAPRASTARDEAPTAHGLGTSRSVTLARQAVDSLLAGDRAKALELYRELARQAPEGDAYHEAVRLLSAAPSDTPQ